MSDPSTSSQDPAIALDVRGLQRIYGAEPQAVLALDRIELQIPVGQFVAIKGRSGSGKTTLLNCIGGLDQVTEGQIYVFDHAIHAMEDEQVTDWRKREVGFVFQSFGLLPTLSAAENIDLMLRIAEYPKAERAQRVQECLELVGLSSWANHRPFELSGGQQQRVAIARSIANRPKIILADEATGELDSETAREILTLLQSVAREENVTILLASHDGLVDEYADFVYHLVDGKIANAPEQPSVRLERIAELKQIAAEAEIVAPAGDSVSSPAPERRDWLIALLLGLAALAVYWRTLAPDILYGDSAEFQTLAYTLGIAHPTGYPVYLYLGRLIGSLPIGTLAFRINLLSAVGAAVTVALLYILGRFVTHNRSAALLAAAALAMSYTFWSQAVIAEVYTVGLMALTALIVCLWHWSRNPAARPVWLFAAALLCILGLGLHSYVVLIAPAAAVYALWVLITGGPWGRSLAAAAFGVLAGAGLYLLAFYGIDSSGSFTSYNFVAHLPSGEAWGVAPSDLETFWQRIYQTISAPQWRGNLFERGLDFDYMAERLRSYGGRIITWEFSGLVLLLAGLGGARMWWRAESRPKATFLTVALLTALVVILNYETGDQHVFYLTSYLFFAIAAAAAMGWLMDEADRRLPPLRTMVQVGLPIFFFLGIGSPFFSTRLDALKDGKATFVQEEYVYPLNDLGEPRRLAEGILSAIEDDAFLLMNWRPLYAVFYIAHVEQDRTAITVVEAAPFRTEGRVMPALIAQIEAALNSGRPVYVDSIYNLRDHFDLTPSRSGLLQLSLPEDMSP